MPEIKKLSTTRTYESKVCPGVIFHLKKMTEGRRMELRKKLQTANSRIRTLGREQDSILGRPAAEQDVSKFMDLQDEIDDVTIGSINPEMVQWGVKSVEGLVIDDRPLTIDDWADFPSDLFKEMVEAISRESGFSAGEEKNSSSPTTSGAVAGQSPESSTASSAKSEDTIEIGTAPSTSLH